MNPSPADRAYAGKSETSKGVYAVERARVPGAIIMQGEITIGSIAFKRVTPHESRIYDDGDLVGEVYRQDDILNPGQHFYVAHLSEDPRGPVRVQQRSRIREVVAQMVSTHPLWT